MTLSKHCSSEFEFEIATLRTQSLGEFAAFYDLFHGGCSSKVFAREEVGVVASFSTQVIDQLRLACTSRDIGSNGTVKGEADHFDVRIPRVDGSGSANSQNAHPRTSDEVVILSAGEGLEPCWKFGNAALNLAVPRSILKACAMTLEQNESHRTLQFGERIRLESSQSIMLKSLFDHLIAFLVQSPKSLNNPNVVACLSEHAVRVMLSVLPHKYVKRDETASPEATPRIVKVAEEYMRQFAGEPLTLARICTHAGCSLRALQSAFRKFRGTTPIRALHEIRLEGAHHDLKNDTAPVTLIAHKWGFSHPGRFSVSYRAKYGEYPSETTQTKSHSSKNAPGRV